MKLYSFLISVLVFSSFASAVAIEQVKGPFPGYAFKPKDNLAHPAIIFLHGSEGGNGDYWFKSPATGIKAGIPQIAAAYAQQGYVTYALCYFDCRAAHPGYKKYPPDELINVDLIDVTYQALAWLRQSPAVKDGNVTIIGYSRGAEQVLFLIDALTKLKKRYPDVVLPKKVISVSPYQTTASGIPLWWAQEAKSTGKMPPENFNVPTWKILGKSYLGGVPISIKNTQIPILITGFSEDPVWGTASLQPYRNQFPVGAPLNLEMALGEKAANKIAQLPSVLKPIVFIEFKNSGHSQPRDVEQKLFFDEVIRRFLIQN